jgi:hypothetical protein
MLKGGIKKELGSGANGSLRGWEWGNRHAVGNQGVTGSGRTTESYTLGNSGAGEWWK